MGRQLQQVSLRDVKETLTGECKHALEIINKNIDNAKAAKENKTAVMNILKSTLESLKGV